MHIKQDLIDRFSNQAATTEWSFLPRVGVFLLAIIAAYSLNVLVARLSPSLVQWCLRHLDRTTPTGTFILTRRMETFMQLGVAVGRVVVILAALFVAWQLTNPGGTPVALIGASTVFAVIAGATLVPVLRDITYGFTMIAEEWFNVGDHVVVEPFPSLGGVVEQITLRSTRLRSVNGEVIRIHNQHIQAVRVSKAASHTVAIETFVNEPERGKQVVAEALKLVPSSSITTPMPPQITEVKRLGDGLWRITAICEVTPYREFLVEGFAVDVIKERDALTGETPVIVHGPLVMYADVTAEKRFQRSVRAHTAHVAKRGQST